MPESTTPTRTAPYTGEEYLESLRDDRAVYIDGERVKDVTDHPGFRNAARSVARLYDAMHDPALRDVMTAEDRQGIHTHRFFMPSYTSEDLFASREAIAEWARLSYGYMGRTPDYKASFMATLGADPEWYAPFADSGRGWYRDYAEKALFLNHVLINPPIDRHKAVHEVDDVYVHVVEERDDGMVVSGAKMLATGSALTHATFVAQNSAVQLEKGKAEDYALVFIAPMDTPGKKLLCRNSYELSARSPWDNAAVESLRRKRRGGHLRQRPHPLGERARLPRRRQGGRVLCAVRVHAPLHAPIGHAPGGQARLPLRPSAPRPEGQWDLEFRGVQAKFGELVGWRNLIWAIT